MNMPGRPPVAAGEITKTSNLVMLGALLGTIPATFSSSSSSKRQSWSFVLANPMSNTDGRSHFSFRRFLLNDSRTVQLFVAAVGGLASGVMIE